MAAHPSPETLQQRSEQLLGTIAGMTGLGVWELAADSMVPHWSTRARQIFGLTGADATLADLLDCFADEARPMIEVAFREAVSAGTGVRSSPCRPSRRDGAPGCGCAASATRRSERHANGPALPGHGRT